MFEIALNWSKAHKYECATVNGQRVIRQTGTGREKDFDPFKVKSETALYKRFAALDGSEDQCLQFAHAWGLLTTEARTEAETIDGWRKKIQQMRGFIAMMQVGEKVPGGITRTKVGGRGVEVPLPSIAVTLVPGDVDVDGTIGRPRMLFEPKTLLDGMYLQIGAFVAGDGILRVCKQCGKPFEAGTQSRRSIAIYCSSACKDRASYQKRRTAA
ncbi:MAG TPA: hypothetical protein VFB02_16510 [Bradyrhizobium sp.]|nr:hypothetical protein [Bradyrhizobium sp.]